MCFASQRPGLCSASLFSSLPLFAHVCLFAGVLRLANHDVAQCCLSFAPVGFCSLIRCVLYGNFLFRVFRLASVGFTRCIPSFSCYLYDFFVSFLSAILCFRIFRLSTGFCLVLFSLSSRLLAYFISCFIRSSFASQSMVSCSTFLFPFILASACLFAGFIVFKSFLFPSLAAHIFGLCPVLFP